MFLIFVNKFILAAWIFFFFFTQQIISYSKYHWKTTVNNLNYKQLEKTTFFSVGNVISCCTHPHRQDPDFTSVRLCTLYFLTLISLPSSPPDFFHCTLWISRLANLSIFNLFREYTPCLLALSEIWESLITYPLQL